LNVQTDVNQEILIPDKVELHQNYPNPFNPETTINYELSKASFVTLKIYNILGQEVRTLIDENKPAGSHIVKWDGKNTSGEYVTSGMYFIRLQADKYTQIKKAIYLK